MRRCDEGFSLIELLAVLGVVAAIAGIATPTIITHYKSGDVTAAISDISEMSVRIEMFREENGRYPDNLAEVGLADRLDKYGNPYSYLRILNNKDAGHLARKDGFLVPLNSDFDLYSLGEDGLTQRPVKSKEGADDIVRANDGDFVGLGSTY